MSDLEQTVLTAATQAILKTLVIRLEAKKSEAVTLQDFYRAVKVRDAIDILREELEVTK